MVAQEHGKFGPGADPRIPPNKTTNLNELKASKMSFAFVKWQQAQVLAKDQYIWSLANFEMMKKY